MDHKTSPLDALHGWLVLAPLAVLCAPPGYSLFDGAPDTTAIGAGVAALGVLPALLVAIVRGRGARTLRVAPLIVVILTAAWMLPRAADSFGAWQSVTGLAGALGFAVTGASLGASGRRVLQRGLGLLAVILLLGAPMGAAWTGALGNTGDLSEAALPCAILGAGAFLTAEGILAFAGFAAILLYAVYAGFVPVYAGFVGLGAATLFAGIGTVIGRSGGESGRQGAAKRLRILLVAMLLGALPMGYRASMAGSVESGNSEHGAASATELGTESQSDGPAVTAPTPTPTPTPIPIPTGTGTGPTTTGGFEFRRLTWARIPDMLGVLDGYAAGPGQFRAAFPIFRDPREIQLSSFQRKEPTPIEVEHAHNDWLTAIVEHGPLGGGAFVLFLLYILGRACRASWGPDSSRRDFGYAAIALLVNAAFNSPLLYGPVAPAIAFTIFGVVGGPGARDARGASDEDEPGHTPHALLRYSVPVLALVALLAVAQRALAFVEYGRILGEIPSARVVLDDGREQLDAGRLGSILARAGAVAPDSPIVLEKQAQLLSRQGAPLDAQRQVTAKWQALRPDSFSANHAAGIVEAKAGNYPAAQAAFLRAWATDRRNPRVLHNLLRVACDLRDAGEVETVLVALEDAHLLTDETVRSTAIEQMLTGRLEVAGPLVERMTRGASQRGSSEQLQPSGLGATRPALAGPGARGIDVHDGDATYQARKAAKAAGDALLADAYNVAFQMTIALDDLEHGVPAQAAIAARQALQSARGRNLDIGPIRLRKAAAKAAAAIADGGREQRLVDEATAILAEAPLRNEDWGALSQIEKDLLGAYRESR